MLRILYLLAIYTGVRAVFNILRSSLLPRPRTTVLDRTTLRIDQDNLARIRVHARQPPKTLDSCSNAGMISVYLVSPGVGRLSYFLLRLTSYFAVGHVEIAFYERGKDVTFFAVRNILRSNIHRLGLGFLFPSLKLSKEKDEIAILQGMIEELRARGLSACLSSPEDCVSLAVNRSLLKPENYDSASRALKQKYERITKRIARPRKQLHLIRDSSRTCDNFTKTIPDIPMRKLNSIPLFLLVAVVAFATYVADHSLGVVAFTYSYLGFCFLAALAFGGLWHSCFRRFGVPFGTAVFAILSASLFFPPPSERLLRSAMLNAPSGTAATAIASIVKQQYEGSAYTMPWIYEDRAGGFDRVHVSLLTQEANSCTALIFIVENGRVSRSIFSPD